MGDLSVCVVYNGSEGGELPALGVGYRGGEFRHRLRYFFVDSGQKVSLSLPVPLSAARDK